MFYENVNNLRTEKLTIVLIKILVKKQIRYMI